MNDKDFFVMLNCQCGIITPLVDEAEELAMFATEQEAVDAANNNILGANFGFEVFERGCGSYS